MTNLWSRSHQENLAMPSRRLHCVRVRRMSERKHQLHRREHSGQAVYESSAVSSMCHHTSNYMSTSLSSHNYKKNYWAASATSSSSHQSRFFHQSTYAQGQQSTESACSLILSSGASPFAASSAHSFGSIGESESCTAFSMLPLPPVVERMDRAGSPLSPFLPSDPYETAPNSSSQQIRYSLRNSHSNHFNSLSNGSARTHSNIGGSGGGGGDGGATAPADMSPGGGDANDGDQPSEYTFRRRNAIVEGSDDAPKADDFPNNSPK